MRKNLYFKLLNCIQLENETKYQNNVSVRETQITLYDFKV